MTARRRAYRLAGPAPSVRDLLSPPLLPSPRLAARPALSFCAAASCGVAAAASRQRNGHPGCWSLRSLGESLSGNCIAGMWPLLFGAPGP